MCVRTAAIAIGLALPLMSAPRAAAQDDAALFRDAPFNRDRNVAVTERAKPEYAPVPVAMGAFVLAPAITLGAAYDDDIYADKTRRTADGLWRVQPALSVQSDWSRHLLAAFARADAAIYDGHPSQSTTDYAVGARGRLDIHHDLGVAIGAGFERDTLPRTSEASPLEAARPVRFDLTDAFVETTKTLDRLRLTAKASLDDDRYDNARTTGGARIYQRDQDHTDVALAGKAEYAYRPNASLFAIITMDAHAYHNALPAEASRTSNGYEADLGSSFDFTRLARGEIQIGYLEQDYRAASLFKSVRGLVLHGEVTYFPSPITTVTLSTARRVKDSGIVDVGGYRSDVAALKIDHELLRNLTLFATISGAQDRYAPYDRIDRRLTGAFGADYLVNRITTLNFAYARTTQNSTGLERGVRFDINRVTLSLTLKV